MKNSYPKLMIELRPSEMLKGEIGLFSVRRISKGAIVAKASVFQVELFISWQEWNEVDKATRQKLYEFCPGAEEGILAPPDLNNLPLPWYINHRCEPNAGFDESGNLVALTAIRPNTEITWDYSTQEYNPKYRLLCRCGSGQCRGIIGSQSSFQAPSKAISAGKAKITQIKGTK